MNWRLEPLTKKQKELIEAMQDFSCFPIPRFTGETRGEASDYIARYGQQAHENVNSPTWGY